MVFFNCNGCGEALKKNQVEKHSLRCRQCEVLSCVDCGKDFWGNDYQNHTKCMTENEKYCGKGYVPKVNKGEVKQEQWIEKVQSAIEKSASNPKLKGVLERMKDYPNIPRKKIKFENFLKNSLRVGSQPLITQVWDTLMAATEQNKDGQENGLVTDKKTETESAPQVSNTASDIPNGDSGPSGEAAVEASIHKLSKRERKEERRKKANKKEKKDKSLENGEVEEGHRKGKKRKHEETEEETQIDTIETTSNTVNNDDSQPDRKKKKKKKKDKSLSGEALDESAPTNGETQNDENEDENDNEMQEPDKKKKKKSKFNWEATVITVLRSKGEMSLKRLSKKVLGEFAAQDAANFSHENLQAKLEKKLKKIPQVKVQKDRVKLK